MQHSMQSVWPSPAALSDRLSTDEGLVARVKCKDSSRDWGLTLSVRAAV